MEGKGSKAYFWGRLTDVQGLQAAQERVYTALVACARDSQKFSCKNCAKNHHFNSSVIAGESHAKCLSSTWKHFLKNMDSVSALRLQCKAKANALGIYSQRLPNWHLNCAANLKFPKDVETWMQAHDHLQSTMDEWECAYEASFCRAQKKAIRAQQLLDSERKRF